MRRAFYFGLVILALAVGLWLVVTVLTPPVITVEWITASELNTAGFNIYRGSSSDDPGTILNKTLIPASLDPLIGGSYEYKDTRVEPGQTYYYRVEEVETDGRLTTQGIVSATAASPLPFVGPSLLVVILAMWLASRIARDSAPVHSSS